MAKQPAALMGSDTCPCGHAGWLALARYAAPGAPFWLHELLAGVLARPTVNSDALLAMADVLEETARDAVAGGYVALSADLRALADLPRRLAPFRVEKGLIDG